jgi:hypothetical protein
MPDAEPEAEPNMSRPSRGTGAVGCAWEVRGTVSRLRMSVTMHPMVLPHMVISSRQPHADLLLSVEAEQCNKRKVIHYITPYGWMEFPLIVILIVKCG